MIKVLWIDDECLNEQGDLTDLGREFIECAYDEDIDITPKSNYKEGLDAIETQPSEWIAVILDIREQKAMNGNGADGFLEACERVRRLHWSKKQEEPYVFVLSGAKQYHEPDSPISQPTYCTKRVYDKNGKDYKILFEDIRKIAKKSSLYQLRKNYTEVLDAAKVLGEDAYNRLFEIMEPILVDGNTCDSLLLNEIRKYLEEFIMPTLERCNFFQEKDDTLTKRSKSIDDRDDVPEYVKRSMHSLVSITQMGSHAKINKKMIVDSDVREGKVPYLLRSCVFELFNIIYWMKDVCLIKNLVDDKK